MTALPATPKPRLKLVVVLGIAAVAAVYALFPYLLATMPAALAKVPLPPLLVATIEALKMGVICGVLGWLGLWLGERHGLSAPWLHAWIYGEPRPAQRGRWFEAILLGLAAALIVQAIDLAGHGAAPAVAANGFDQAWRGLLASFYGGIVEEVLSRLFTMSLLVWLLARWKGGAARPWMFVVAIVLSALLFGAGHLPGAFSSGTPHTLVAIARIVLLNTVVGVAFGWLYWKRSLEHAMVAHFSADLVLHVFAPFVLAALA